MRDLESMNLNEWEVTHKITGEIIELSMIVTKDGGSFNKVYLKEFSKAIECTGKGSVEVLGYLLKNKNNKNEVSGTQRIIAELTGVSVPTVARTFKALTKHGFIKIKHSGLYIINPKMLYYGATGNRIAILKVWDNLS